MALDEYKFNVIVDGKLFEGYLRIPKEPINKFNRNVLAYLELEKVFDISSGVKKVTIVWPKAVYPYVLNPSNVVFELDGQIIMQHGITANIDNHITEHVISVNDQFTKLVVYVFDDKLCQSPKTVVGSLGDIKECNVFNYCFPRSMNDYVTTECCAFDYCFPRAVNEYTTTECNVFDYCFPRSVNEYVNTECNAFNYSFPRSFNENVTCECSTFGFCFSRGIDYSISLK